MTDQASQQGSPRGNTVPPPTPGPNHSAKDATLGATAIPTTPGGLQSTIPSTPRPSSSPFPVRTLCTPGDTAVSICTADKALYATVTVHTAKCTECDRRNKTTMLRCPGCTFQLCEPCHDKRQKRAKGLAHGNMATPSATDGAQAPGSVGRTVRKRPFGSMSGGKGSKKKLVEINEEAKYETATPARNSTAKKHAAKKKRRAEDTQVEDSPEEDFEPENTSPTPSKRRRAELTFAQSALATAIRAPPATRASRKACQQEHPNLTAPSGILGLPASVGYEPSELQRTDLLYQHAVVGYDEPLLGRRELVMSNPVAMIPAIVKRGGQPRPSADEIHQNIQDKVREKMQRNLVHGAANERPTSNLDMQRVSYGITE